MEVEVFSNLMHVTSALWEMFEQPGVRLACSYYSDEASQHAAVTGRVGSHARTRANIVEALRRSIPLRVGIIDLGDGQRVDAAIAELEALGVADVGFDRLRQVGRGVREQRPSMNQLCGHCASDVLAVAPDGTVWPCVFSRWLPVGNVLISSLAKILVGGPVAEVRNQLTVHFTSEADPVMRATVIRTATRAATLRSAVQAWLSPQLQSGLPAELLAGVLTDLQSDRVQAARVLAAVQRDQEPTVTRR